MPGVDGDTAKFITDATIKDLPTLAKTFVEQKRTLSQPRPFEMPKEGDAEGFKKLHAALGVPETADKYDFGDVAKGLKPDDLKEWAADLHKLGVPNKTAQGLVGLVLARAAKSKEASEKTFGETAKRDVEATMAEWAGEADRNKDLATRGYAKVAELLKRDNTPEFRDRLERALGTKDFLKLGLIVGRNMVEAGFVGGQSSGLTVDAAKARRAAMLADEKTNKALYDSSDPNHGAIAREWAELLKVEFGVSGSA